MQYLTITTLIWAFSFGLIGNTLKGIDPMQIADMRLLLAAIVFLPFLKLSQTTAVEKGQLMALGAVQFGVMYTCYMFAFRYLPSHLVALFSVLTPLYVVIIYDLSKRKFNPWYLLAASLSVLGAAIIKTEQFTTENIWLGFGLMQVANLSFAFGQVYYRNWRESRPGVNDSAIFGLLYLGAVLFTSVITLLVFKQSPVPLEANAKQWAVLIYLGFIASGLGFFFWNKGGTKTTVGTLSAFNNAVVPLAMFASLFVFGEADDVSVKDLIKLALGSCAIVAALMIGKRVKSRKKQQL
ncbi:EamA family transporter [Thalassotalea mangrovi]|uniref:EamA family transporter n=1 Tax=Thalassotalea mangrovi TaxID=2572245 RepID=A0A4U1B8E2_9GAMM|nr:EamA family transporter [Thalassotalea mangrovi]TKB46939.1 EamA family transporter [Thalassotalea mangrovi]